ncbi:MAG: D-aminoacyl-tRNA deacylase, partial [Actinobacteria bacterium]
MRVILQRVSSASVSVGTEEVASIGAGFLALVGIAVGDGPEDVDTAVSKIRGLRVFPDDEGRMNLGIADVGGSV